MATQLHSSGENLVLSAALGARDMDVGLYNDSTDTLADTDGYAAITTEPSGSAYAAQTVTGGTVATNSGDTDITLPDASFDTSDSTQSVDAVYIRDTSSGDLIFTCDLDGTYDLSNIDTFNLSNTSLSLE